jgi:thioredoxin 1
MSPRLPFTGPCAAFIRRAGGALLLALLASFPVLAQEKEPFSHERFLALQAQNAVVLIDVFADWCPTCAQQQRVLAAFQETHPDVPLHILTVDFDTRKDLVTQFKAPRQSTLILYRGEEQIWFSVAETRQAVIFEELLGALERQ